MSEKPQQPETCTVIDDRSQGSVAMRCDLGMVGSFTNTLLQSYC